MDSHHLPNFKVLILGIPWYPGPTRMPADTKPKLTPA